jgi:glutamine---fructose-6-phosphate transaminase (isomerizing)
MFKTNKEIFSQYEALEKTYSLMLQKKLEIKHYISKLSFKKIIFTGCGSSYSLCKSAALSINMLEGIEANAIAAGDLMMNFPKYNKVLSEALIITPSRSGSTSELIFAVEYAKKSFNSQCICISAKADSALAEISDLVIEIPWAFDESVCQTRTVTNLYLVNLMLIAFISDNVELEKEIGEAIKIGEVFMAKYTDELSLVAKSEWERVVVLADLDLEGIAEEGSLAFKEICQLQSNYYHILDVRHGPMVLVNERTLVIMALSPFGETYQKDLINEIISKGAKLVIVGNRQENNSNSLLEIIVPEYKNYGVMGIPFIFVPQALSYFKALALDINPDEPSGLDAWIKL